METIRLPAEIVRRPEGAYEATCASAPGCIGTGPTPRSALRALHEALQDFLKPALKHCSPVGISLLVVAPGIHASPSSERKSGAMSDGVEEDVFRLPLAVDGETLAPSSGLG